MHKVYVQACARLDRLHPDPDFSSYLSPMEARRMNLLLKRTLVTALEAAGPVCPDGIVTGTGMGSVENTTACLEALLNGTGPRPTDFMQSTHNTLGSLVAIRLGCHGYNATYAQLRHSFESALLDAWTQIRLGDLHRVLVCACDQVTPALARMLTQTGIPVDSDSYTAAAVLLTDHPDNALAEVTQVSLSRGTEPVKADFCRDDWVRLYGDNLSVSALGFCDAVGQGGPLILANEWTRICIN